MAQEPQRGDPQTEGRKHTPADAEMQNGAVELDDANTASSPRLFQARFRIADSTTALAPESVMALGHKPAHRGSRCCGWQDAAPPDKWP